MRRNKYSHIEFTFTDKDGLEAKCLEPIATLSVIQMGDGKVIVYVPDDNGEYTTFYAFEPYSYFRELLTGEYAPQTGTVVPEYPEHQPGPQEYVDAGPEVYPVEELPGKDPEPRG